MFRVHGPDQYTYGASWTPIDPVAFEASNGRWSYRHFAGLPDSNTGSLLTHCDLTVLGRVRLVSGDGTVRPAQPLGQSRWNVVADQNPGTITEYYFPRGVTPGLEVDNCKANQPVSPAF